MGEIKGKEATRRIVRARQVLKHYKSNVATAPSLPDDQALTDLLADLRLMAEKAGISYVDCDKVALNDFLEQTST